MGYVIDFDLSTVIIFSFVWIGIITFLRLKKQKSLVFLLFFTIFYVYIVKVLSLTQFPIYLTEGMRDMYGQTVWETMNFIPLVTLTYASLKTSLLNILMTIPFGFGLPFITNFKIKKTVVTGIIFAVFLEILQLIIALMAKFTFRIVDINDIIFNTLGVFIGYLLFLGFICLYRFFFTKQNIPENPILLYIAERPQVSDKIDNRLTAITMKKILPISIAVILVIASGSGFYYNQNLQKRLSNEATSATQVALAKLQVDLQNITPHFIDSSKASGQVLTPEEQKIKDDVIALLSARQKSNADFYSKLWLSGVGKRYILVSQPSGESFHDEIIDSQTGEVTPIFGLTRYFLTPERNIALYIDYQAIYTYSLDQANAIIISNSLLFDNESYYPSTSNTFLTPTETHTKDSITISVFDSSQKVQSPNTQTTSEKIREVTLTF